VAPLILATAYYFASPFFSELVRKRFVDYLDAADREWHGQNYPPPHRTSEALAANIDWIIDVPQVVPCFLLPLTAAIFAFRINDSSAVILIFAALAVCVATLWIYNRSPLDYRSMRIIGHRYTLVAGLGMFANAVTAILVLVR